jgi:hypothetical protein
MIVWTGTDRQRGMNRCRLMGVKNWVFRIACFLRQLENVDFAFEIMRRWHGKIDRSGDQDCVSSSTTEEC